MKLVYSLIFLFSSIPSFSQQKDSLTILHSNIWRPNLNWANSDTISLKPIHGLKPESIKFLKADEPKDEDLYVFVSQRKYGEYIYFDFNNKIKNFNFQTCSVGETIRNINSFKIKNDTITITYLENPWNDYEAKKEFESYFKIIT